MSTRLECPVCRKRFYCRRDFRKHVGAGARTVCGRLVRHSEKGEGRWDSIQHTSLLLSQDSKHASPKYDDTVEEGGAKSELKITEASIMEGTDLEICCDDNQHEDASHMAEVGQSMYRAIAQGDVGEDRDSTSEKSVDLYAVLSDNGSDDDGDSGAVFSPSIPECSPIITDSGPMRSNNGTRSVNAETEANICPEQPVAMGSDGDSDSGQTAVPSLPSLKTLHERYSGEYMEGEKDVKYNMKATDEYYPFPHATALLWFWFVDKHQLSRQAQKDLKLILTAVGVDGSPLFKGEEMPVNDDNFIARFRQYLPLGPLIKREVRAKTTKDRRDAGTETCEEVAHVYGVPLNFQIYRMLNAERPRLEQHQNPGGMPLFGIDAASNRLGSDHFFPGPVMEKGATLKTNMNGEIARSSPFLGYDGVVMRSGNKIYIGETLMADVSGGGNYARTPHRPCRLIELFWDRGLCSIRCALRIFRTSNEIWDDRGPEAERNKEGIVKVWEETGRDARIVLPPANLYDFCEVITPEEFNQGIMKRPWARGTRRRGWTFIGEGFLDTTRKRGIATSGHARSIPDAAISSPWKFSGVYNDNFVNMRAPDIYHNVGNLPFVSLPLAYYIDGFRTHGLGNQVCTQQHLCYPRFYSTVSLCKERSKMRFVIRKIYDASK